MENNEALRKKKQQYLYSEIIEAGHDATIFQEFLNKKKLNGTYSPLILLKFLNKRRNKH